MIRTRGICLALSFLLLAACGSKKKQLDFIERCSKLQVTEGDVFGTGRSPNPKASIVFVDADWEIVEGVK